MNYKNMVGRMIDGLAIILTHVSASVEAAAQSYAVMIPEAVFDDFSDDEVQELFDLGWSWNDDMGWVLPVLG